jgi:hypothetical protein
MKPADIHRQLCEVHIEHAVSDLVIRKWVSHFNEGCENMHDMWSGQLSVVNEDFVHAVEEKIQENGRFTILSVSLHIPQISPSVLHKIVSDKPRFWKLCSRRVPKMLTDEHKMNKRCGMLSCGVVMLHGNVCPHTAAATQDVIMIFGWEQVNHLPYSPDLVPSDFNVFLHLRTFLGGRQFHDDIEVK